MYSEFTMNALDQAIEILKGPKRLADALGVRPNVVSNWRKRGVPIDECPFVVEACNDPRVTCESLRPDYEGWAILRRLALKELDGQCA